MITFQLIKIQDQNHDEYKGKSYQVKINQPDNQNRINSFSTYSYRVILLCKFFSKHKIPNYESTNIN